MQNKTKKTKQSKEKEKRIIQQVNDSNFDFFCRTLGMMLGAEA